MAYATIDDLKARLTRDLTIDEEAVCITLLDDAAIIIDAYNANASDDVKKVVSCDMVKRAISTVDADIPMGATQGSMSGLGYSQSWTLSGGSSVGELYLTKLEKKLLGVGNSIGSHSPVEDCVNSHPNWWGATP